MTVKLPKLSPARGASKPPSMAAKFLTFCVVMILILGFVGLGVLYYQRMYRGGLTDVRIMGSTVHVPDAGGGKVYLLTGQKQLAFSSGGEYADARIYTSDYYVDLWAISAQDAKPSWRRRVHHGKEGDLDGHVLGVDGNTIWLYLSGQLVAASKETGDIIAPKGHVVSLNPELKDVMPDEQRYYQFDSHGLRIMTADGRAWRIAGDTFKARLDESEYAEAGTAISPAHFVPAYVAVFQDQSLEIPGWWLGMLTDEEAKQYNEGQGMVGLGGTSRRRLWRAKETTVETAFGPTKKYMDYQVLPASPEFLDGGLFKESIEGVNTEPMWFRDPDSVLVLHRDRLGDAGTLRLTRVAGPEGTVVWDAPLPLTILQTATRGEDRIVLFGFQYFEPESPDVHLDPMRDGLERLVIVDIATGAIHVHDHADIEHHIEPVKADTGL